MKINFQITPNYGHNVRDQLGVLLQDQDLHNYLTKFKGIALRMELKPMPKTGTKQRMYDFYNGVIIPVAMQAYMDAGYEMLDEVQTDYLLKAECAKGSMVTPEGEKAYLLDKSKMTKERLTKFVADVLLHLEMNLNVKNIPDAEMYKNLRDIGGSFKSVKHLRNE